MELQAETSDSSDIALPAPSPAGTAPAPPPRTRASKAPWIAAIIALVAAAAFAFLWQAASSDLDKANESLADVTDERDELQAAEDARVAEEEALPNVYEIVTKHLSPADAGVEIEGDETYASIDLTGTALYDTSDLGAALKELGFPNSILDKIGNTRALDGTLTSKGEKVTASWTYHPDDGLSLVIELDD